MAGFEWLIIDRWGAEVTAAAGVEHVSAGYRFGSYDPAVEPAAPATQERDETF